MESRPAFSCLLLMLMFSSAIGKPTKEELKEALVDLLLDKLLGNDSELQDKEEYATVHILDKSLSKSLSVEFPDHLPLQVETRSQRSTLLLSRNQRLHSGQIQLIEEEKGGIQKKSKLNLDGLAFYQDAQKGGAITAHRVGDHTLFEGTLIAGNKHYELTHTTKDAHKLKSMDQNKLHKLKEVDLHSAFKLHQDARKYAKPVFKAPIKTYSKKTMDKAVSKDQKHFNVEIMYVYDYTTYDYWMSQSGQDDASAVEKMNNFFVSQFNGIDMVYRLMSDDNFSVLPWLKKILICKTEDCSSFTKDSANPKGSSPSTWYDYNLNSDNFFTKVNKWAEDQGLNWWDPDHIMVWTRYDIGGDDTVGVAPLGGICGGFGSYGGMAGYSVQEARGLHAYKVAAHELGHNLGARHDGQPESKEDANGCVNENWVMAPSDGLLTTDNAYRQFRFSSCTIEDIKTWITGQRGGKENFPRTCVYDGVCDSAASEWNIRYLGEKYSLAEQCQFTGHFQGPSGQQYTYDTSSCPSDDICLKLICSDGAGSCMDAQAFAAEGTECGTDKWCMQGQCVEKGSGTGFTVNNYGDCSTSVDVPSGCSDQDGYVFPINFNNQDLSLSCADVVKKYPIFCFTFGDQLLPNCGESCTKQNLAYDTDTCEAKCEDVPGMEFQTGDGQAMNCQQAASSGGCSNPQVSSNCCQSCQQAGGAGGAGAGGGAGGGTVVSGDDVDRCLNVPPEQLLSCIMGMK